MITIDDFAKVEIRVGTVLDAVKVPDADRLIKLTFDFGDLSNVPRRRESPREKEILTFVRMTIKKIRMTSLLFCRNWLKNIRASM
jgi:hypothetical protein